MPSPDHRLALGARVRELRVAKGWSQEHFAHVADLDRTYVSGVERGQRNPTVDVLQRLANALGVAIRDLF